MVSKAVISLLRCCVISFGLSRLNEEITDCFNFFSLCIIISHDCYYTDDSLEQEAIIFFSENVLTLGILYVCVLYRIVCKMGKAESSQFAGNIQVCVGECQPEFMAKSSNYYYFVVSSFS